MNLIVWGKIEAAEFKTKVEKSKGEDKVRLEGTLYRFIPFYENSDELPIEFEIDLAHDDVPRIHKIQREIDLKKDMENGISLEELKILLMKYYHN